MSNRQSQQVQPLLNVAEVRKTATEECREEERME